MELTLERQAVIDTWQEPWTPGVSGDLVLTVQAGSVTRLLVADACGHGPAAAHLAQRFRTVVGVDLMDPMTQDAFLRWNQQLVDALATGEFVAVTVIEADRNTGLVRIWNAGNPAPVWLRRGAGRIEPIEAYAMPVGAIASPTYVPPTPVEIRPAEGDAVLVFSDGLTDQRSGGDRYGDGRLCEALDESLRGETDPLRALQSSMDAFRPGANVTDDLTAAQLSWRESRLEMVAPAAEAA